MDIKRTDQIQQVLKLGNKKFNNVQETSKDSVNLSDHAKKLAEVNIYKKLVLSTPDVRENMVKAAKEKLENGFYLDQKMNNILADKLSQFLSSEEL